MANAYTPGLKVSPRMTHRVRRILPIKGEVLVEVGTDVAARDIVARTYMPGDVLPVNVANKLSMPAADVPDCMLVKEGDSVKSGDVLARTKGIFGMFKAEAKSDFEGTVESVSDVTGQVIIRGAPLPVQVEAYISGTIVEVVPEEGVVIEADVAFVQGIFGIGGETYGEIKLACKTHEQELTADLITPEMKDCVIVGGARMHDSAIEKARSVGAAGVVSGGLDDQDLRDFLGYDLGVAITGSEKVGLTLIVTEGFGDIAMAERTFDLLRSLEGRQASINGTTQIRAGVMRPEVVIPLGRDTAKDDGPGSDRPAGLLEIGTQVRIIRDPYFGLIGKVSDLPSEPQVLGSGSKARVLAVKLNSGESVVIPRANVELIEG